MFHSLMKMIPAASTVIRKPRSVRNYTSETGINIVIVNSYKVHYVLELNSSLKMM